MSRTVGEDVVLLNSKALLVRVQVGDNSLVDVGEGVGFYQDLSAHARVDTGDTALIAGAVDVSGAETDRRQTRVDANEGVVVVGNVKLALVLGGIVVRVAYERALPLLGVSIDYIMS